jgi:hypothetical protein
MFRSYLCRKGDIELPARAIFTVMTVWAVLHYLNQQLQRRLAFQRDRRFANIAEELTILNHAEHLWASAPNRSDAE